jgi:hypothetical protein
VSALDREKMSSTERWTYHLFPLAVGNKGWKNGMCGIDLSTGKVEPAHAESDLFIIGRFAETIDATSAEKQINVNLGMEIEVEWWAQDASIEAADVGSMAYALDDQTVGIAGSAVAGRIWAVDSVKGVAVEKLQAIPSGAGALDGQELTETTLDAFSSNAIALADNPNSQALHEVPVTAAASVITLPAVAPEGTVLYFTADGVLNGHTVQYRDATGAVNLTTALTALKRHLVIALFLNGTWRANAYVSP